jgi:hypothetical protein
MSPDEIVIIFVLEYLYQAASVMIREAFMGQLPDLISHTFKKRTERSTLYFTQSSPRTILDNTTSTVLVVIATLHEYSSTVANVQ